MYVTQPVCYFFPRLSLMSYHSTKLSTFNHLVDKPDFFSDHVVPSVGATSMFRLCDRQGKNTTTHTHSLSLSVHTHTHTHTHTLMDQYETNAAIPTTSRLGSKPCGTDRCMTCKHICHCSNIRSSVTG